MSRFLNLKNAVDKVLNSKQQNEFKNTGIMNLKLRLHAFIFNLSC